MSDKKFEVNSYWRTRDGHRARIICVDAENEIYPIVALVRGYPLSFAKTGRREVVMCDSDLISPWSEPEKPKEKKRQWLWEERKSPMHIWGIYGWQSEPPTRSELIRQLFRLSPLCPKEGVLDVDD